MSYWRIVFSFMTDLMLFFPRILILDISFKAKHLWLAFDFTFQTFPKPPLPTTVINSKRSKQMPGDLIDLIDSVKWILTTFFERESELSRRLEMLEWFSKLCWEKFFYRSYEWLSFLFSWIFCKNSGNAFLFSWLGCICFSFRFKWSF